MTEAGDGYDLATIMLAVEVYKLRRDHPAEPADSIAEMLGRMLALAEFSQPADSDLLPKPQCVASRVTDYFSLPPFHQSARAGLGLVRASDAIATHESCRAAAPTTYLRASANALI